MAAKVASAWMASCTAFATSCTFEKSGPIKSAGRSRNVSKWRFGIKRQWPGNSGRLSRNATEIESSNTIFASDSRAPMRQNEQESSGLLGRLRFGRLGISEELSARLRDGVNRRGKFAGFHGHAIAECNHPAGICRNALAGHKNADKIQRIGGRDSDAFAHGLRGASGAQRLERDGQCELFAEETAHKSSAAHFAAVFEAAQSHKHLAPTREDRFAGENFAEDPAVTIEQHSAGCLDGLSTVLRHNGIQQRPASRAVTRTRTAAVAMPGAALRIDQRTQIIESIGGDNSGRDQFPESRLDFRFQFAGAAHNIGEEGCAAILEELKNVASTVVEPQGFFDVRRSVARSHPIGIIAHEERNRGNAGGHHAATSLCGMIEKRWMR